MVNNQAKTDSNPNKTPHNRVKTVTLPRPGVKVPAGVGKGIPPGAGGTLPAAVLPVAVEAKAGAAVVVPESIRSVRPILTLLKVKCCKVSRQKCLLTSRTGKVHLCTTSPPMTWTKTNLPVPVVRVVLAESLSCPGTGSNNVHRSLTDKGQVLARVG